MSRSADTCVLRRLSACMGCRHLMVEGAWVGAEGVSSDIVCIWQDLWLFHRKRLTEGVLSELGSKVRPGLMAVKKRDFERRAVPQVCPRMRTYRTIKSLREL